MQTGNVKRKMGTQMVNLKTTVIKIRKYKNIGVFSSKFQLTDQCNDAIRILKI